LSRRLSRRKFIATGVATAAGAVVASTLYLRPDILARYLCDSKPKIYDGSLVINQETSHAGIDYPGLNEYEVVSKIELQNTSIKPLEKLQVLQKAPQGFELKSVRLGRPGQFERDYETIQPKVVDNTAVCSLTEPLKPNERLILVFSYMPGWEAMSGDFQSTATAELYVERYELCWISELFHIEPQKEYVGINSNTTSATVTVNPAPKSLKEIYESGKKDWARDIAKRRILMQYPVTAELQEKYWKEPNESNAQEVAHYFYAELEKAGQPYNEVANELRKLPDLQNGTYTVDLVKAMENIVSLCLLYETSKDNIQKMLDEGIAGKRKYCAPLQALLWLGKKEMWTKAYNTLNSYSPKLLLQSAWDFSEDGWKDLDLVVKRLNFPIAVDVYMSRNFTYYYPGASAWHRQSPQETFRTRRGDCENQSIFARYCLAKNGYAAYILVLAWTALNEGHVCCLYKDKDGQWYFHDNTYPLYRGVFGPFTIANNAFNQFVNHCRGIPGFNPEFHTSILDIEENSRADLLW
jgi:predicted transglutaminase-like cysteine proteinase